MIDYTKMKETEMLVELGVDARKWAEAFNQHISELGHRKIDEGFLIGWFANCIETADLTKNASRIEEMLESARKETIERASDIAKRAEKIGKKRLSGFADMIKKFTDD